MTFQEVKINQIISVFIKSDKQNFMAYYQVKNIRQEKNERIIDAVLAEETKELVNKDLNLKSEITLDFYKWSDIVYRVSSLNEVFLEHFINNEDVDGASQYAFTLDKEEAVKFLKDFSSAMIDLIYEAREHMSC